VTSITKILVATDLTDRSNRALERAFQLKRETGAELTLLHVVKPGLPTEIASRQRKDADAFLRDRLPRPSGHVIPNDRHAVLVGDKFITITQEAAKQRADLIVVGAPGKYRYDDLFVGTTAERVIRFSDRPVLVVKRVSHGPYDRVLVAFDMSEGATRALDTCIEDSSRR
jgi:universal stress protein E